MKNSIALFVAVFLALGCRVSSKDSELMRCHEGVSLDALLKQVGVPQQRQAWSIVGGTEVSRDTLVDLEQRATLTLPDSAAFMADLCDGLRQQLASRCDIRSFEAGPLFCNASTVSRSVDTTDERGRHFRRPSQGRLTLSARAVSDGRTEVVLTATEWAN